MELMSNIVEDAYSVATVAVYIKIIFGSLVCVSTGTYWRNKMINHVIKL